MRDIRSKWAVLCTCLGVLGVLSTFIVAGCATRSRGFSFRTLGVPSVYPVKNQAIVIIGWENEATEGWWISAVRLSNRSRVPWNQETQHPVVLTLPPGGHELRLLAERRTGRGPGVLARRYRTAPTKLDLAAGSETLCKIRLGGSSRVRPRLTCSTSDDGESASAPPILHTPSAPVASPPAGATAGGEPANDPPSTDRPSYTPRVLQTAVESRLSEIEARLERLERSLLQKTSRGESSPVP